MRDALLNVEDNRVEIDEENMMAVPYNGGNHPEYASNCFSTLNAVYLKDNTIYLDIEDCEEYEIENVDTMNIYEIMETVFTQIHGLV